MSIEAAAGRLRASVRGQSCCIFRCLISFIGYRILCLIWSIPRSDLPVAEQDKDGEDKANKNGCPEDCPDVEPHDVPIEGFILSLELISLPFKFGVLRRELLISLPQICARQRLQLLLELLMLLAKIGVVLSNSMFIHFG